MPGDKVGILGYGVYIPWERIKTEVIVREREKKRKDLGEFLSKVRDGLLLRYKSIASHTEDTTTIATEAAENALLMAQIDSKLIETVAVGSESKPYAVGTTARHVASFVGVGNQAFVADLEGACNSGMQALSFVDSEIKGGKIGYGLAIGADVAQAPKGDPLEYSAGAGAGAFILGYDDNPVATIEDVAPYSSLLMDFWRRDEAPVPKHFGKTTVYAYMSHVTGAIEGLLKKNPHMRLRDFDHITFHQPSGYMPLKTCRALTEERIETLHDPSLEDRMRLTSEDIETKIKPWLRVLDTGNTYAASTPIAIASILDKAKPGDDVLAVSYGSGAYCIATWIRVEDGVKKRRGPVPSVDDYVNRRTEIRLEDYMDHVKERLRKVKRRLQFPRTIAEIEPGDDDFTEISLCGGCRRIFYPARDRCLDYDCPGPLIRKQFSRTGYLKSFEQLSFKKRLTSSFDILSRDKVLIVDTNEADLAIGMDLERVVRRLEYDGKDGLIFYGPCYRPLFREAVKIPQPVKSIEAPLIQARM